MQTNIKNGNIEKIRKCGKIGNMRKQKSEKKKTFLKITTDILKMRRVLEYNSETMFQKAKEE